MDITVTLDREDLYTAVADYLAKHGQNVDGKSIEMDIKAGRGVAQENIGATVTLSTKPRSEKAIVVQQEEPVVAAEPEPKAKPAPKKVEAKVEESVPFDDDSADEAKKSLFQDPKGRAEVPKSNPLFG